ncbi:leucine-rich repeat domain-containing protein [Candidatus Clostridium stratigraminis]|uniref:Leucine-rich repeat domain-containing protein n=1 Tax=Candidatus Clostridium stratigraminis TaxID=3381661 RepID=A0ABW8TCH1_9CLOT
MLNNKRFFSALLSASLLCGVLNVAPVFAQEAYTGITRLSGNDRYGTALAISKSGWMQANTVIIATGTNYPDALSAAPLAKANDAPILLTEKGALSSDTISEIKRLKATKAILVGGTGVITTNIENQLKNIGVNFTRIGGINRYETSKLVAEKLGTSNGIIVATGLNFPDALSIAPIAGIKAMPILLSPKDGLDPSVASFIKGKTIPVSYIVGETGVLGNKVYSSVPNSIRLGGINRYETNRIINKQFEGDLRFGTAFLATGNDFPDALSGSALAAKNNAPIILTDKNSITNDTLNFIKSEGVINVSILGGTGAISKNVQDVLTNTINNNIVNPSSVSLNKTTNILTIGTTDTLIATVSPSNATNKNVQWSTSNSNVATVDAAGKVTAIGTGTATITVTTVDGNKIASCTITVNDIVTFKDKNLEQAVRNAINKPEGTIYKRDVVNITYLDAFGMNISDIGGIENLSSLQTLDLGNNQIRDISALKGLTNLRKIFLDNNQINDINALNGLTNLQSVDLDGNQISNINALKELTSIQGLSLSGNKISDIGALRGLTNLMGLGLTDNLISDISTLRGLTNLKELFLSDNQISDISTLIGLTNLQSLDLTCNQISDISTLRVLTNLQSLGLASNQIKYVSALKGLTNLQSLSLDKNEISDISDFKGLINLQYLNLIDNQISNISALKELTSLQYLILDNNQISDISALKGLTNIQYLFLDNNQISDISALNGLTNLQYLFLDDNQISDISALKELASLYSLYLDNNQISDINALTGLINLQSLGLIGNHISITDQQKLKTALPNCEVLF